MQHKSPTQHLLTAAEVLHYQHARDRACNNSIIVVNLVQMEQYCTNIKITWYCSSVSVKQATVYATTRAKSSRSTQLIHK